MSKAIRKRAPSAPRVVHLEPVRPCAELGHKVGWVVSCDAEGRLLVDYPGNAGPVEARVLTALAPAALRQAIEQRQQVLLAFEGERPIVLGVLIDDASTELEVAQPSEALVDGRRVVLEGKDEIALRCGASSITLTRNGRVVIRGTYVVAHSRGVHRIKGGSVQIN